MLLAQGNCSEADQTWMAENQSLLESLTNECGFECATVEDPNACVAECMEANTELSASCISCFVEQVSCITSQCLFICLSGTETECADCIEEFCLEDFYICSGIDDADGDGYNSLLDCDDNVFEINSGAEEIWYDGIDQNCDGLSDFDQDMDGEDAAEYGGTDCNDQDPTQQGGQVWYYTDSDMDGYGKTTTGFPACNQPPGTSTLAGDCDDTNPFVYPGAPATAEGSDNNCDGFIDADEEFLCLGDYDLNGAINSGDFLVILSDLTCTENCTADLTGDGIVDIDDILAFLSIMGTLCQAP